MAIQIKDAPTFLFQGKSNYKIANTKCINGLAVFQLIV